MTAFVDDRHFQRHIILPISMIVAGLVITIMGIVIVFAHHQTEASIQQQRNLARGALDIRMEALEKVTDDYAYWDESFVNLSMTPNAEWADKNVGSPVFEKYGFDIILVLNSDGRTDYGMKDGRRSLIPTDRVLAGGFERLFKAATADGGADNSSALLTADGHPALVAISKLRPYEMQAPNPDRAAKYLVFVDTLGAKQLEELSRIYQLPDLHMTTSGSSSGASVTLRTLDDKTNVILAWTNDDPGGTLLNRILPMLGLLLTGIGILTFLVLRQAAAAAHKLHAAEAKAQRDALTGMPNRLALFSRAEQLFAEYGPGKSRFALIYLDLDGFKAVNDRLGHHAGDVVLQLTANRISDVLDKSCTFARLGGDEFAIILPGVSEAPLIRPIGEAVIAAVSQPIEIFDEHISIGATIGIAIAPDDARETLDLIKKADMALYQAKRTNKGTIQFFFNLLPADPLKECETG